MAAFESFTHKIAAWKICLQDGGNAAFLRVLPTRWRRGKFAYKMAAFLTVDNAQSHVTAFRPISEAARSWSDDNENCAATVTLNILSLPVK